MSGLDVTDMPAPREPRKIRRAGGRWRLLVHEALPGGRGGDSYHVQSFASGREDRTIVADGEVYRSTTQVLAGTEFDELVVGRWIHLEQMDTGAWWMNVGGVTLWVRADRDGRPTSVHVYGPGQYADPVDGVEYGFVLADPPSKEETACQG